MGMLYFKLGTGGRNASKTVTNPSRQAVQKVPNVNRRMLNRYRVKRGNNPRIRNAPQAQLLDMFRLLSSPPNGARAPFYTRLLPFSTAETPCDYDIVAG